MHAVVGLAIGQWHFLYMYTHIHTFIFISLQLQQARRCREEGKKTGNLYSRVDTWDGCTLGCRHTHGRTKIHKRLQCHTHMYLYTCLYICMYREMHFGRKCLDSSTDSHGREELREVTAVLCKSLHVLERVTTYIHACVWDTCTYV